MSKGIIIRMWHDNRDHFEWRYHYFASCVLPRLQAQTVTDFDICILSNPHDHDRLKQLDSRIRPFTMKTEGFDYPSQGNFTYSMTQGLKRYDLQIRMDSDDLVAPDFVEKCVAGGEVTTFQPELFILSELRVKKMNMRYSQDKPSMFMSYRGEGCIYREVFFRFGSYDVSFHKEGTCWMTIHEGNRGTTACS